MKPKGIQKIFDGGVWVPRPTKKCPTCGGAMLLQYDIEADNTELIPCKWFCKRQGHGEHLHPLTDVDKVTLTLSR